MAAADGGVGTHAELVVGGSAGPSSGYTICACADLTGSAARTKAPMAAFVESMARQATSSEIPAMARQAQVFQVLVCMPATGDSRAGE